MKSILALLLICCFRASAREKNLILRGSSSPASKIGERRAKKGGEKGGRSCDPEASDGGKLVMYSCRSKAKSDVIGFEVQTGEQGASIGITYKHETKDTVEASQPQPSRNLGKHHDEDKNGGEGAEKSKRKKGHDHHHGGYVHSKIEGQYTVTYSRLVEYLPAVDTDERGFSWDEDDIVQEFRLSDWDDISEINTSDDGSEFSFHVTTTDRSAFFNFTLSTVDDDADDHRRLLSGNRRRSSDKMKIDARFDEFPWKRNDTYLALLSSVEAMTEIKSHEHKAKAQGKKKEKRALEGDAADEGDNEGDIEGVEFEEKAEGGEVEEEEETDKKKRAKQPKKPKTKKPSDAIITFNVGDGEESYLPFGEYTWVPFAEGTNMMQSRSAPLEVVATSPIDTNGIDDAGDDAKMYIAYSFIGSSEARRIYWDPSAGVGYDDATSGAVAFGLGGGIAGVMLFAVSVLLLGSV